MIVWQRKKPLLLYIYRDGKIHFARIHGGDFALIHGGDFARIHGGDFARIQNGEFARNVSLN